MPRVTKTTTYLQPTKRGLGGVSAGQVGTGSPGKFASTVRADKDYSMSRRAESGSSPKMKTVSSEH